MARSKRKKGALDLSHGGMVLYEMISKIKGDASWNEFETNLGKLDYQSFEDELLIEDGYERENLYSDLGDYLWDAITYLFNLWARSIDISPTKPLYKLDKNAIYLTFNYTMTLEKVYGIIPSNILHLHGSVSGGDCIIGHVEDDASFKRYKESEKLVREVHNKLRKEVEAIYNKNQPFFNRINASNIEDVYVLGHSLSKADDYYFEKIFHKLSTDKPRTIHFLDCDYEKNMQVAKLGKMFSCGFRGLIGPSVK